MKSFGFVCHGSLVFTFLFVFVLQYVLGDYHWKSYTQVDQDSTGFGLGLRSLGQEPRSSIVMFAETREEWMIAAHGCFKQNIPSMFQKI